MFGKQGNIVISSSFNLGEFVFSQKPEDNECLLSQ